MRVGRLGAVLAVCAGLAVAAGCGSAEDYSTADVENGKTQFANLCSSCHTLDDSGRPPSQIGPNLDDAFRASRQVGMHEDQCAGGVQRWIREAQPPMPRDLVQGQDAIDVAAYVASVAGQSEESAVGPPITTPEVPEQSRYKKPDDEE